jgi:hypothetical protein
MELRKVTRINWVNQCVVGRVLYISVILYIHVARFGWLSDQDQTLVHYRNHFTSMVTCNWTPLEESH